MFSFSLASKDLFSRCNLTSIKPLLSINEFVIGLSSFASLLLSSSSRTSTSNALTFPQSLGPHGSDVFIFKLNSPKLIGFSECRNYTNYKIMLE